MSYAKFRPLIESAAARPELWRVFASLVTIMGVCVGWAIILFVVLPVFSGDGTMGLSGGIDSPLAMILFLLLIVGLGLGTWLAGRIWHGRSLGSMIGQGARTLRDFVIAALVTWGIAAIGWLVVMPFTDPLVRNMPFDQWLSWLPIALVAILLQTGSEELLFRGYLQSQLAARFRATWVWLLVPSLMFGALHYLPGETMGPGMLYVAATTLFGVIAADLTARTGSIGAAWGLHFANNCLAILVVVYLGAGSGLGLYSAGTIEDALSFSPLLILDICAMVVIWLAVRRMVTA